MSFLLKALLTEKGLTPEGGVLSNSTVGKFWRTEPVSETPELLRIRALPRRRWQDSPDLEELRLRMSAWLRKPGSSAELLTVQAVILAELAERGRVNVVASVGSGKTLACALAPTVLNAKRPLFLSYAKLIEKTVRDFRALSEQWRVQTNWEFFSAESLSIAKNANYLDKYCPDVIVVDESHVLGNIKSGRSKRIGRYLAEHPECVLVPLTGTPGVSLLRFAHILEWSLGEEHSPLPTKTGELAVWASAVDPDVQVRREPGALSQFSDGSEVLEAVRNGVGQRIEQTPGVVYHRTGFEDCSLYMGSVVLEEVSPELEAVFEHVRKTGDELPDGRVLETGLDKHILFETLGLGFARVISPPPPEEWRNRRREFASFVSEAIHGMQLADTPGQLTLMIERGEVDSYGLYEAWKAIEPTFKQKSVVQWFDDSALHFCAKWMDSVEGGLLWCPFPAFSRKLKELSKRPYFGEQGVDSDLGSIEGWTETRSAILSFQANSVGRNLQRFNRNLLVGARTSSDALTQCCGRTHRQGQPAEQVTFDFLLASIENLKAVYRARGRAEADRLLGRDNGSKLIHCDWLVSSFDDVSRLSGARWAE